MTSEEFKKIRIEKGYTQKKLAEAIGFSEDYISKIERNEQPITDYILEKLNNLKEKKSTIEEILNEADEKNKKEATKELIALGDRYLDFLEQVEEAKLSMKDIVKDAKVKGITKDAYIETAYFKDPGNCIIEIQHFNDPEIQKIFEG